MTEAQKKASKKYDAANTRTFTIKLNYNTDADAIAYLETQGNVQGLIKGLIREKIGGLTNENHKRESDTRQDRSEQ